MILSYTCSVLFFVFPLLWTLTFNMLIWFYVKYYMVTSKAVSVAEKQDQIMIPPPPCLTLDMRCLCWCALFGFLPTWRFAWWSALVLFVHRGRWRSPLVCSSIDLSLTAIFRFIKMRLSNSPFTNRPCISFSCMLTEACRVWDLFCFLFAFTQSIPQSDLVLNLRCCPILGGMAD